MTGKSCDENHYHLTVCSHEWTNREPVCATPSFTFPLPRLLPLLFVVEANVAWTLQALRKHRLSQINEAVCNLCQPPWFTPSPSGHPLLSGPPT